MIGIYIHNDTILFLHVERYPAATCACHVSVWPKYKLALVYPTSTDPKASMVTLVPVTDHTFRLEGKGYGAYGELVVFETGSDDKVERMKVGENYVYPQQSK